MGDFLHSGSLVAVNGILYGVGGGHLFAMLAATGRPLWAHRIGQRIWTTDSDPAVGDGHLIIGDWAGVVWCLDAATGVIRWSAMPDLIEKLGVTGSALVHTNLAVVPTITGFAVAYDLPTGQERWRTALDGPCSDELMWFQGSVLLQTHGSVYLLDPSDGRVVLRWNAGGPDVRECLPAGDVVLASTWEPQGGASLDARGELIALSGGTVAYRRPAARWPTGLRYSAETRLVYEARQDGLGIIDPRTGDRLWDLQAGEGPLDRWCGTPDVRDRVIYALTADGRLYALRHPNPGETGPRRRRARQRPQARPDPPEWSGALPNQLSRSLREIYQASGGVRRAMDYAQAEARRLGHRDIGTEHLLLGILRFGYGLAATPHELGVQLESARDAIEALVPRGPTESVEAETDLQLSRSGRRAIRRALVVALRLGHRSIAGEELLLGIAGEKRCTAVQALERMGVKTDQLVLTIQLRWLPSWLARPPVPKEEDPWGEHLSQFSDELQHVLRTAKVVASAGPPYILALEQLLVALLGEEDGLATALVRDSGSDMEAVHAQLATLAAATGLRQPGRHGRPDRLSVTSRLLGGIRAGADEARRRATALVKIEHLLLGLIRAADRTDVRIAARVGPPEAGGEGVLALIGIDPDRLQIVVEERIR